MTDLEQAQRLAVIAEARTWIRTPHVDMARVKGAGVDCAMLPAEAYFACGLIPQQEVEYYPGDWHLHRGAERYLERVKRYAHEVAAPLPGDLVLYRYARAFAHGGIITGWPSIIHALKGVGVTEDDGTAPHLAQERSGKPRERLFFSLNIWSASE